LKPNALYYRVLSYQRAPLSRARELFELIELDDPRNDTDAVLESVSVLFAPLGYALDKIKLDRCPNLRAVISNTTGVFHIDMKESARRGIAVCALHDEQDFLDTITPTAEHTIGLMLAAWRQIPAAHKSTCEGNWDRRPWGAPRMFSRLRLGIVGYGRLGRKVADIARAMGMAVDYYDPYIEGGLASLNQLASNADILSLHAPANAETENLISSDILAALPSGAMVINTARGELLDTDALLDLLESGHLHCAALDTIDGEYDPNFPAHFSQSRLVKYARNHDNLILTPHIGGSTIDAWSETQMYVVEKAARALGLEPAL